MPRGRELEEEAEEMQCIVMYYKFINLMLNKYDSYVITCLDFKKRIIHMSRLLNSGQIHCGSHNYYLANKSPKLLTQPWPCAT